MGRGFDVALYNNWKPKTVVSATRIEPPLHPSDPAKIVLDFGLWPETDVNDGFKVDEFTKFVSENKKDIITNGIFAPWLIHKDDFNDVKGHDPIMKSHSEDRDLFNRFLLNGYILIQSWEALVYHLTCRGGQFEHASNTQDLSYKSNDWNMLAYNQTREFIRKWGSPPRYDEYQYPIISPKYNIGFIIKNCNTQLLEVLEPWCSNVYIKDNDQTLVNSYIKKEQLNTKFYLKDKIQPGYEDKSNDIFVTLDSDSFNQQDFQYIQQLNDIIKESGEIGEFQLGNLYIKINSLKEYQNDLICI
jgi:hypothetical protein